MLYDIRLTHLNTSAVQTLMSGSESIVIRGLSPYSHYLIEVAAFTVSLGPFSTSLSLVTLEDGE